MVCTLFTIKNLLQPELFNVPGGDRPNRAALLVGLTGKKPVRQGSALHDMPDGFAIVIDVSDGLPIISIMFDSRPLPHINFVPPDVAPFAAAVPRYLAYQQLYRLIDFLNRHPNRYPIIIRFDGKSYRAIFDPTAEYAAKVRYDLAAGMVTIRVICTRSGNLVDESHFLGDIVFDLSAKTLGILRDKDGLQHLSSVKTSLWREGLIDSYHNQNIPVTVSAEDLNRYIQLYKPAEAPTSTPYLLTIDKRESTPIETEFSYQVRIEAIDKWNDFFAIIPLSAERTGYLFIHIIVFSTFLNVLWNSPTLFAQRSGWTYWFVLFSNSLLSRARQRL